MTAPAQIDDSLRAGLRPIVILGAGRSGTKFLRRLLASSNACGVVPYGVSYAWRQGNENYPHDALPARACSPYLARKIRRTLLDLANLPPASEARYLVEKTSANTLRVAFVDAVLPDARYVHLVRDGRDVVESALRRWSAPPDPRYLLGKLRHLLSGGLTRSSVHFVWWYFKNLVRGMMQHRPSVRVWGPRYPGIAGDVDRLAPIEVCARQWRTCVESTLHDLRALPDERIFTVRYEELVRDAGVITDLCHFLQLPDATSVLARYNNTICRDHVGKGRRTLSKSDLRAIMPLLGATLSKLGYE